VLTKNAYKYKTHKISELQALKNSDVLQKLQNFYKNDSAFYESDTNEYIPT